MAEVLCMSSGGGGSSGNAQAAQVSSGKTFSNDDAVDIPGSMPNIGAYDNVISIGNSSGNLYFRIHAGAHKQRTSMGVPEAKVAASTVLSTIGVQSVSNFKATQASSRSVLLTWARPSSKPWTGLVICARKDRYPSNVDDYQKQWITSSTSYTTGAIDTGYWYFRAWNYVDWTGGRYYGGYVQTTYSNQVISGTNNFTSSTTWQVPAGVTSITGFCVGGGGCVRLYSIGDGSGAKGGAGGGYTKQGTISVTPGETLSIIVGAGGDAGVKESGKETPATASSIRRGSTVLLSANGGQGSETSTSLYDDHGCNGGSGGGQTTSRDGGDGGDGGVNGGDGKVSKWSTSSGTHYGENPGRGQGTSTTFNGVTYAGGGGGGGDHGGRGSTSDTDHNSNGYGGGGRGSSGQWYSTCVGQNGLGGGAGGVKKDRESGVDYRTAGGSGCVIIKYGE